MTTAHGAGQTLDRRHRHRAALTEPDNFTIFEGTSEIQRMLIGRAVTGLDVRLVTTTSDRIAHRLSAGFIGDTD